MPNHFDSETGKTAGRSGHARMKAIAEQNKGEASDLISGLLGSLQRDPTPAEELMAELIAVVIVRSRRLRETNRDDSSLRRELARLVKNSPWAATPAPAETAAAQ